MDFRYEHFNSIYEFESALKERPINSDFADCICSKDKGNFDFFQTETYEESEELLEKGWNVKIDEMKKELENFSRKVEVQRTEYYKNVAGFAPCVPNSIRGVPKSMIASKKINSTKNDKTLHLIINNCGSSKVSGETLMKSGMSVLKLAILLEKAKVKTKIDIVPKAAYKGDSCYGCTVNIKDYKQPFNLSKIAYPLAHTSIFRRQGFRWLETQKGDLKKWTNSYGFSLVKCTEEEKINYMEYAGFLKDGVIYIDLEDTMKADFDPYKLAELKNIALKI